MKPIRTDNPTYAYLVREGYADAYKDGPRPVWKIGVNYNPETRNLDKPAFLRA